MTQTSNSGSSTGPLYFIVGGLVVAVAVVAFLMFGRGDMPATTSSTATTTEETTTTPTTTGGSTTSTTTTTQETQQ